MRHLLYIIMCAGLVIGCGHSESDGSEYSGIPSTAQSVAENEEYVIFLNDEDRGDSIEGLVSIKQVSLWTYDKDKIAAKKILLTHPDAERNWFGADSSVSIPLDSITTISRITILSWRDEPLRLLVEGCSDLVDDLIRHLRHEVIRQMGFIKPKDEEDEK